MEELYKEGHFIIIDVLVNKKNTIANLYIPVKSMKGEQLNVFRLLQKSLQQFRLENIIIGGDFNLYLDPRLEEAIHHA